MIPTLGVCYYPEHWDEAMWASDAARMVETGITWVRIAEFAWSRIEPAPDQFEFDWLDRAISLLGEAGLKVVMCTPTATPPRWMLDKHPDMLAVDADGRPRKFGSRRHYCFSHAPYIAESARIACILGERYGRNPHIHAWQIDNEYGCHETTISYSDAARDAFRVWLADKYGDVKTLNSAWGNVFWSMDYDRFDQIDLPNLTVTEANPAHVMAFRRFSSDQVVAYNRAQVDVLRDLTDTALIHNYMGRVLDFDHFAVGADLDIASWDSYPIGFLSDRLEASEADSSAYLPQGAPDMQAFHHDLYRAVGRGRWWVMEQQPGPVNWAPYNPAPLPGMVRLWSWEAIAHGAEVVSYFRWRQAPFAQEQNHAGLLRPDDIPAPALAEAALVADEIAAMGAVDQTCADVALVFDYASDWAWTTQPQGADFDYFRLTFETYQALRRAGLSVDIVPHTAREFDGYKLILAPGLVGSDPALYAALLAADAQVIIGPRSATVTDEMSIPVGGAPAIDTMTTRIELHESLPPHHIRPVIGGGHVVHWQERLDAAKHHLFATQNDAPVLTDEGAFWYLGAWPDAVLWDRIVAMGCAKSGMETHALPKGLRLRQAGQHRFAINYSAQAVTWQGVEIAACGVVAWDGDQRIL